MSEASTSIGRVISFTGIDDPVMASAADVSSDVLTIEHVPVASAPLVLPQGATAGVAPVLVFQLAHDLRGPNVTSADVLRATVAVLGGLAVWDESSVLIRLVLGTKVTTHDRVDLGLLGVLVDKGSDQVATSCGAATLGHPAAAIATDLNRHHAEPLAAGWLVAAGPMTPLVGIAAADHVTATFAHLGSVSVRVD